MTPQAAILPATGTHALFLIIHLSAGAEQAVRIAAARFPELLEQTGGALPEAALVGTLAFGPALWRQLSPSRPRHLRPFKPLGEGGLHAPATGGDLLLHLHSERADLNFLAAQCFLEPLRPWLVTLEETPAFRYLDSRDLTGFIDGTENPKGQEERAAAALIGDEDADFAGGSYVLAQRFVHRLAPWRALSDAEQEQVIGRTKPDSVELDDSKRPPTAHISRVVIEEQGEELEIVRHSLPYGSAGGDAGLFFLAYARDLSVFEKMLTNMFGENGDGLHDRLMEFTRPVSGGFFFAPSLALLRSLAAGSL